MYKFSFFFERGLHFAEVIGFSWLLQSLFKAFLGIDIRTLDRHKVDKQMDRYLADLD